MPSVEFPCQSFQHSIFGVQYRPYALIALIYGKKAIPEYFLVDSGADTSVIGYTVGLRLGLKQMKPFINCVAQHPGLRLSIARWR